MKDLILNYVESIKPCKLYVNSIFTKRAIKLWTG